MPKPKNTSGMVFSTNPDYLRQFEEAPEAAVTPPRDKQKLRVKLDTKQRAGKVVTLIEGFAGRPEDLEVLGKELKTRCGAGGSVKEGCIIIQGDYKEKVLGWLRGWGYTGAR